MRSERIASAEEIAGQIITVEGGEHLYHRNSARLDNRDTLRTLHKCRSGR